MADWALIKKVHLFAGLEQSALAQLADICSQKDVAPGDLIIEQNTTGSEMYIIAQGSVEADSTGHRGSNCLGGKRRGCAD
jgi:signal-transduction protein with cAMP-binding, CBS, and nucleotidyltransferase domain